MTATRLPRWVRWLLSADRGVEKTASFIRSALGRVICACVPVELRDDVTAWVYGREEQTYRPGNALSRHGLFPWESEAIRTPPFPAGGRLLVGGVGGGRELAGLASLGIASAVWRTSVLARRSGAALASSGAICASSP